MIIIIIIIIIIVTMIMDTYPWTWSILKKLKLLEMNTDKKLIFVNKV